MLGCPSEGMIGQALTLNYAPALEVSLCAIPVPSFRKRLNPFGKSGFIKRARKDGGSGGGNHGALVN